MSKTVTVKPGTMVKPASKSAPAFNIPLGDNVEGMIDGDALILRLSMKGDLGVSGTGRSTLVAATRRFIEVGTTGLGLSVVLCRKLAGKKSGS